MPRVLSLASRLPSGAPPAAEQRKKGEKKGAGSVPHSHGELQRRKTHKHTQPFLEESGNKKFSFHVHFLLCERQKREGRKSILWIHIKLSREQSQTRTNIVSTRVHAYLNSKLRAYSTTLDRDRKLCTQTTHDSRTRTQGDPIKKSLSKQGKRFCVVSLPGARESERALRGDHAVCVITTRKLLQALSLEAAASAAYGPSRRKARKLRLFSWFLFLFKPTGQECIR